MFLYLEQVYQAQAYPKKYLILLVKKINSLKPGCIYGVTTDSARPGIFNLEGIDI